MASVAAAWLPAARPLTAYVAFVLAVVLMPLASVACDSDDGDPAVEIRGSEATPTTGALTISLQDTAEAADVERLVASASAAGELEVSDRPIPGARAYTIEAWAAVAHQRADALELTLDEVRAVVAGDVTDWSELGGTPRPIELMLPSAEAERIAQALGVAPASGATLLPAAEVAAAVEETPGAFALLAPDALRPGVLALIVDGHDPYRDPAAEAPVSVRRWLDASSEALASEAARALGWGAADARLRDFDPVGFLATGEMIAARCVTPKIEQYGPAGMFDGTRERLQAADLVVTPLETSISRTYDATPCQPTFQLQAGAEVVPAIIDAGVDVMITAGNHAMDCFAGCGPGGALLETLDLLDEAGLPHAGAGPDLASASTPAVVESGGTSFAFLAYDDIAWFYAASDGTPGTAPLDLETLGDDVRAAVQLADHVVVAIGWGVEYTSDPTERQRSGAAIAVEAGASMVLGMHPHWNQAMEFRGDQALVTYALGNFIFDQDWSIPTQQGLVMEVGVMPDRLLGFRLLPVFIEDEHRPEFLDPAGAGAEVLDRTWDAADRLPPWPVE
ncbi:MAG: hypothetical protein GEU80_00640 [Dehalococcoidia bacterium]|nr:hypothetical protein [Dehalococcoidia bacterium]